MKARVTACLLAALPVLGVACLGQPDRSFFEGDGSADVTLVTTEAAASDVTAMSPDGEVESGLPGDDGQTDGGEVDAEASLALTEAGLDANAVTEAGCGPIDTITHCGACQNACDTAHSNPLECAIDAGDASTCLYTSCAVGFADCVNKPPNTNGCETPITTTSNCNGCGIACNTTNSTDAGCGATGCTYACAPGWSDCNTAASNTGGCACNTPACCGTACETTHSNGVGNSYYDCNPLNTRSYVTAHEACAAYTGDPSPANCMTFGCNGEPSTWAVVCSNEIGGNPSACVCWEYAGGNAGKFDTSCLCPASFDGTWN